MFLISDDAVMQSHEYFHGSDGYVVGLSGLSACKFGTYRMLVPRVFMDHKAEEDLQYQSESVAAHFPIV